MDQLNKMQEIMALQHLQEQMETLSKQLEELQEKQSTISITLSAVQELETIKVGSEILSPIADGIFIRTQLTDNTKAIVNIGKGITVEKNLNEVKEMVKGHEEKINLNCSEIESKMQEISNTLLEKIALLEMNEDNEETDHLD